MSTTDLTLDRIKLKRKRLLKKHLIAYSMLIPVFLSVGLFKYYPFYIAVIKSFYQWNGANINKFIGLENFSKLLSDPTFLISMKNVAFLTVGFVIAQLTFPLLAAVGIFHIKNLKIQSLYKLLLLVPLVVPTIIVFLMWKWIYLPYGVINQLLESVGLSQLTRIWLGKSDTALWAVLFVNFPWIGGIFFLIFLAGLISIPQDLFEVAKIDGMNAWKRFIYIEMPLIRNQIRLIIILAFIQMFQSFENVLVLTNGGPGFATHTPALYMYKQGFEYNNFGYASAMGVVVFIILITFTILANKYIKPADKLD